MRVWASLAAVLLASFVISSVAFPAAASHSVSYRAGATTVVKESGQPPKVDRGIVICKSTGVSIGGGCLPFSPADNSVRVLDDHIGLAVAFQVCIDNDGDGLCGGTRGTCADDLFFSHNDAGDFYNPLGPLPMGFKPGCSGGFPGYVVFLCQGIHFPRTGAPHHHTPTKGTISGTTGGSGFGDFCQALEDLPPKQYFLQ